jgi:Protein of unknown function (DUF2490)
MQVMNPREGMMTISRKILVLAGLLGFFSAASDLRAQAKDFQSWWELGLNKKLTSRFDLDGELEQRFQNNSLQYSRSLATLGASYDLFDFLEVGGGARTVFLLDEEQQMHLRYRFNLDLEGSTKLSRLDLSLRTRLQYGFDDFMEFSYFRLNSTVNRNRLKGVYHIFGSKFDCFSSVESWHGANREKQWLTFAMRYSLGVRYSMNFRSRFSLRYIMEDEFNLINPEQLHVLVLSYSYKL